MQDAANRKIRIFGLDYGRGTMAGFYYDMDAGGLDAHAIMDKDGEPSGFAVLNDGSTRVGTLMYTMGAKELNKLTAYHVNVKGMPHDNVEDDALQVQYARIWRNRIIEQNPQLFNDGYEEYWIIGCPTGWRSKKIIENYTAIFTSAGFKNVIIVPESNAAMMYVERQYGFVNHVDGDVGALCVDLGAYSSDSTYVRPRKSVASYGGYVGASLIEKMLVRVNFKDEYRIDDKPYVSADVLSAIQHEYKINKNFQTQLLIAARKLKEQYYSAIAKGKDCSDIDVTELVPLDDCLRAKFGMKSFPIYVNDLVAKAIVYDHSVKAVLEEEFNTLPSEVRDELGDKSWAECLEDFLKRTLKICPDFASAAMSGEKNAYLIVTGGASLMPFVQDTISKVMPRVTLYKDDAPMSTIAKGLVYFGPDKIRALEFEEQFQKLLSLDIEGNDAVMDKHNDLLNTFASRAHDALSYGLVFKRKGALFTSGCTYEFVEERENMGIVFRTVDTMVKSMLTAVNAWGDGVIDSDKIASEALREFTTWFNGSDEGSMSTMHTNSVKFTKEFLAAELNDAFAPLLEKYNLGTSLLSSADLTLEFADLLLNWWRSNYGEAFKPRIENEDDTYRMLPNPSAGLLTQLNPFVSSRQDVYNAEIAGIKARNVAWWESARTAYNEINDKPENYGLFKLNCMKELRDAIESAKRTKLGELIVEDSFDEDDDPSVSDQIN